jgi:peptide/nickel transport system permease protein
MLTYVVRRLLWALVLCTGVTFVTFVLFYLAPSDAVRIRCGGQQATRACIERVSADLGVDDPVVVQYARFVWRLVWHRSLGQSFLEQREVSDMIVAAAPVTLSVVFGGVILWIMIGFSVGIASALRPRSLLDRGGTVFTLVGISLHPLWIGLMLSYVVGFRLGWTPITGYCDVFAPHSDCGGVTDWASHLILPWVTFALVAAAAYARMVRASMLETLSEDYVRTARAKGMPEQRVIRSHVLRNALIPVVTMLAMDISFALGGAVFIEAIFSLPGLGSMVYRGIGAGDLPVLEGVTLFATLAIVFFNLAVDLLYGFLDPRVRVT